MLPTVDTGRASAVGNTGMTVNGTIHPHGLHTSYYFEYGPDVTYGNQTARTDLPPRLAAHYRESWDHGTGGWHKRDGPMEHHASGGAAGGFVRYHSPTLDDHNHDDGIGTLHLASYLYIGAFMDAALRESMGPHNPLLSAGEADLRGAEVSLYVRGHDWQPNGSELIWWTQSQSDPAVTRQPDWRCDPTANWAYTGCMLTDALRSGNWEHVTYCLRNDSDQWSFGGYYTEQPDWKRYDYWPIDLVQAKVNYDFFHLLAFVDPDNPPRGWIDFDEFELVYRNRSLVFPSNGGRLMASPASDVDAATLTDGRRHGAGHMWHSAENPRAPQEFVYAFDDPVTVNAVQLHQNHEWPTKEVECLVSDDGETYEPLCELTLPNTGIPNDNLAFAIRLDLSAPATHLKVRILSGHQPERWGLGEIEVFGSGARMLPDDALYEINTDIGDLEAGTTIHYRLVAVNANGTIHGPDQTFDIAADARPQVRTTNAGRITSRSARVEGRINPMGRRTTFHFEYGLDKTYGHASPPTYAGLQDVPRIAFADLDGLECDTTYHYRLVATNDVGEIHSSDATFRTAPD